MNDVDRFGGSRRILTVSIMVAYVLTAGLSLLPMSRSADSSSDGGGMTSSEEANIQGPSGGYVVENAGQVVDGVRYYAAGNPSAAFRDDGVMFALYDEIESVGGKGQNGQNLEISRPAQLSTLGPARSVAYLLRFEGANAVRPAGRERAPFLSNFFLGNDPGEWRVDVPSFREVVYEDLYDGIDLIYRPTEHGMKYEFILSPGTNLRAISLQYQGVQSLEVGADGITAVTALGEIRDSAPYSYQEGGADVRCGFSLRGSNSYGFDCAGWDGTSLLTIDPLIYSTFLGGSGWDRGYSIKVNDRGKAYVTGQTRSIDFPTTPGVYDTTLGGTDDAYVTMLSANGSELEFSTYIGGGGFDRGLSITLDDMGHVYVAGDTLSSDFPTTVGAFSRTNHGNSDGFVTKLAQYGNALLFSTYIGGADNDTWPTVAVDAGDSVYIAGITGSADFPTTPGAFDVLYNSGDSDAFVLKMHTSGSYLIYSTFLGGNDADFAYSIALDAATNVYVTGGSWSADFPTTPGAFDTTQGGESDVFVTVVGALGGSLVYSTFLGGSGYDVGLSIAADSSGLAYITGSTISSNFPVTPGAYDSIFNGGVDDAFITKLNSSSNSLIYSTFFGGGKDEYGNAIAVDAAGHAYITGSTDSDDLPVTPDALDGSYNGLMDAFVSELNETGFLKNSTYLGGSGTEGYLNFLTVTPIGEIFVTGITNSTDFPITPGAFDTTIDPNRDAYVTKLAPLFPDLLLGRGDVSIHPSMPVMVGTQVEIWAMPRNIGSADAVNVVVRFYDGMPSGSNRIDVDHVIPLISSPDGIGFTIASWNADSPGMHNICVFADPDNSIVESREDNNIECQQLPVLINYTLSLAPGHRFMSYPIKLLDDRIEVVLSSLSGCYDYVRRYDSLDSVDPWKSYDPSRGYNDIIRLDNTMGFWINVTATCDFNLTGYPERSTILNLRQGWNMVGYPSFNTSYTVADLKAATGLPGVIVETFDANAAPYYLQKAPDSFKLAAGEGYWVFVPSDVPLIIFG